MFLELWMICILAMMFGLCALTNYNIGIKVGIQICLHLLHKKNLIDIEEVTRAMKCQ
jgi:hypothetical protein